MVKMLMYNFEHPAKGCENLNFPAQRTGLPMCQKWEYYQCQSSFKPLQPCLIFLLINNLINKLRLHQFLGTKTIKYWGEQVPKNWCKRSLLIRAERLGFSDVKTLRTIGSNVWGLLRKPELYLWWRFWAAFFQQCV